VNGGNEAVITKQEMAAKFEKRARTWERAYEHPGSESLGEPYVVFFSPRLFSDRHFWEILDLGDCTWRQIVEKAFSLSTVLCFGECGWSAVELMKVEEVIAGRDHLMVRLGDGGVFPLGSRCTGDFVETVSVTCSVADLTFDHIIPLEKILRGRDRPGLRWLSGIVWDSALHESNEKDPRKGDWCKRKDGTRYPPKEWLGAKKLKKAVMARLRHCAVGEAGPHLALQSEVADNFACATELMLRSSNSSQGAKKSNKPTVASDET